MSSIPYQDLLPDTQMKDLSSGISLILSKTKTTGFGYEEIRNHVTWTKPRRWRFTLHVNEAVREPNFLKLSCYVMTLKCNKNVRRLSKSLSNN